MFPLHGIFSLGEQRMIICSCGFEYISIYMQFFQWWKQNFFFQQASETDHKNIYRKELIFLSCLANIGFSQAQGHTAPQSQSKRELSTFHFLWIFERMRKLICLFKQHGSSAATSVEISMIFFPGILISFVFRQQQIWQVGFLHWVLRTEAVNLTLVLRN